MIIFNYIREYFALIEKYLRKLINYYKNKGEWKVQFTAEINFIYLKPGSDETRIMHTRSDNIEIMIGDDNDDVIEERFKDQILNSMVLIFCIMILIK